MSNRIRYTSTDDINVVRSVKTYQHPTNGGRFYILIDTKDLSFKVMDEMAGDEMILSGDERSLHKLKIRAKEALMGLGIEGFETEVRKPRPKKATDASQII